MPELNSLATFSRACNRLKIVTKAVFGIKMVGQKNVILKNKAEKLLKTRNCGKNDAPSLLIALRNPFQPSDDPCGVPWNKL